MFEKTPKTDKLLKYAPKTPLESGRSSEQKCRVVWHDLLTPDVARARHFYADLLGWKYQVEYAANFVWKPGAAEYPLIWVDRQAHGGFVDLGSDFSAHWIAYVRVEDVDAVAAKAREIGAAIVRDPFEIPGVGRTSVIEDLQGAAICPFRPRHNFPAPSGTFLWDELIARDLKLAQQFYGELFGWKLSDIDRREMMGEDSGGRDAISITNRAVCEMELAVWVPYLATNEIGPTIARAEALGARVQKPATRKPQMGWRAILSDPTGALFGLLTPD